MRERPAAATAFGIINVLTGVVVLPFVLVAVILLLEVNSSPEISSLAASCSGLAIMMACFLVYSILALVSGVGLLKVLEWGRRLAIGLAIVGLVAAIPLTWIQAVVLPDERLPTAVELVMGQYWDFVYGGLLIYLLTRPEVKEAFADPTAESKHARSGTPEEAGGV